MRSALVYPMVLLTNCGGEAPAASEASSMLPVLEAVGEVEKAEKVTFKLAEQKCFVASLR